MEYPFHIELDISQDDFIRAEILEMGADTQIDRREDLISFIVQSFLGCSDIVFLLPHCLCSGLVSVFAVSVCGFFPAEFSV